ncbi:hypothetical protein [Ensifer sp. ZNC0028]|nr:hypothetical protein [Ensifer sp. ZNC0028]
MFLARQSPFRTTPEFWLIMQTSFEFKNEGIALHGELEFDPGNR